MLQDSKDFTSNIAENPKNQNDITTEFFLFLDKENLSQEEFENKMNHLLSLNFKEKESLLSISKEQIVSMINNSIKFNNIMLSIKLLIYLTQINTKEFMSNIDFNEYILICFQKLCEIVEIAQNSKKIR